MSDPIQRLRGALADHYVIERQVGTGGMATVYLARDTKHDRQVALKLLRPELAAVLGTERFLSEIRVMAHLQHPHILPLHDSGETAGLVYYVMPYVEGESLRDRLTREKQLTVEDALEIARVVASALDYAHRHDVVHRDIKPENILLPDGQAVVADFGIALALSAAAGNRLTETGLSLGTPQYMSPEQATGDRLIDSRSDIYSLACVLYEMLAGEPPHTGPTVQSVIAKVVTDRPRRLSTLRASVPAHVEAAVHKALAKIPADRFTTVAQFAEALARPGSVPILEADAALPGTVAERAWRQVTSRRIVPWAVATFALVVAGWGWLRSTASMPQPVARFTLTFPPDAAFLDGAGVRMVLSPDGSRLVYMGGTSGNQQLYLRPLDRLTPVPIADTRGAFQPFFSPDGKWLGFVADDKIRRVSLEGGAATTVCTSEGVMAASWSTANVIVFVAGAGSALWQVSADGGEPRLVARADTARGETYRWPEALPGGRAALLTVRDRSGFHLAAVRLETGVVVLLGLAGASPHFVAPGYLLFARLDGSLLAAPFDPRSLRITGPVLPVAEGVTVGTGGAARLGVSASGGFAYQAARVVANVPVFVDRRGREEVVPVPPQKIYAARLSPDARSIVFDIGENNPSGAGDLWVYDLVRSTLGRLTFDSSNVRPVWTPDGRRVAFARVRQGLASVDVWWIPADRSDSAERLVDGDQAQSPAMFTPDGRALVYEEINPATGPVTGFDIWVLPLVGDRTPKPYLRSPFDEASPAVSPDGRWLAYASTESGHPEVYVRAFPVPGAGIQISSGGGRAPRWAPNGRELFYRTDDSLVAVSLSLAPVFKVGSRRGLFALAPYLVGGPRAGVGYDVHPDGRRFLMIRQGSPTRDLVVVLNWFDQLRGGRGRPH